MERAYDRAIGYSDLERVDPGRLRSTVELNKRIIDDHFDASSGDVLLDAGPGLGHEAVFVNQAFGLQTIGVDLHVRPLESYRAPGVVLSEQDLMSLALADACVSLVYCYHVLEHVPDHVAVLSEFYRILRPGGVLFAGFPNSNRLVSYIDTSQRASLMERLNWNIQDLRHRFSGTFRNELGAHAGFAQAGFVATASEIFEEVIPVRQQYMVLKYRRLRWVWGFLAGLGLDEYAYPSNYFICKKAGHERAR